MTGKEFLDHCTAQGGNWTGMIMSGIRECFPEYWDALEDRSYSFEEVVDMTRECGVNWDD